MMDIAHNQSKSRFELPLEDKRAILEYKRQGNRILFTHTEVPPEFEGRGIGARLVKAGLAYARSEALEIVPLCSFVAVYLKRHPEEGNPS